MKKILFILALAAVLPLRSQTSQPAVDSAEMVVSYYLDLLNYDHIPKDTMLYIRTVFFPRSNPADSSVMKRWFWAPYCFRTEIWTNDTLVTGYYTNSYDTYRRYNAKNKTWYKIDVATFFMEHEAYDFRGRLYHRKKNYTRLQYDGVWNFNGHEAYRIFASRPGGFDRYYMFEKESGLLFLIDELDNYVPYGREDRTEHVDWRGIHEYQPVGNVVFPSQESYQINNEIVVMYHTINYVPLNKFLFIQD